MENMVKPGYVFSESYLVEEDRLIVYLIHDGHGLARVVGRTSIDGYSKLGKNDQEYQLNKARNFALLFSLELKRKSE